MEKKKTKTVLSILRNLLRKEKTPHSDFDQLFMYTMMPINEQGYPSLTRGGASLTRAGASLTRGGAGVSPHGFVTSPTSGSTHHPHQPLPPAGHRSSRRSSMKKQRHRSEQAQAGAGYFIRLANSSPMIKNNRSVG